MLIVGFIVIQSIIFLVVFLVLRRMMVKSTASAVNRLQLVDEENAGRLAETKKKIEEMEAEYRQKSADLPRELEKLREEAKKRIEEEKNKVLAKAREEGERIVEAAKNRTEKSDQEIEKEFHGRAALLAGKMVREILSDTLKSGLNERLIDELLHEIEAMDTGHVPEAIQEAEIVLAEPLKPDQMKRLKGLLEQKLTRPIEIRETVRKEMGGGLLLKLGSLVVDGSLENVIDGIILRVKKET